ncbi:MAG: DUF58 domain-containing protein [Deltaproteobacteria bacterium]|nr:MAG: DUF58 domain-containing protein [Deltaproteobacteria bacterium]
MTALLQMADRAAGAEIARPQAPVRAAAARFVPRGRLAWLLAAPALLLLVAPVDGGVTAAALAIDASLLLAAFVDAAIAARARIEATRAVPPHLSVGVPNRISLRLLNRGPRTVRIEVLDQPPPSFEGSAHLHSVRIPPFSSMRVEERLVPTARGRYRFGDLCLRVRGPLGLAVAERRLPLCEEVKVYPDLRAVRRLALAGGARTRSELGIHELRREGEGSEFETLREYGPGDAYRDIDWKATARRGEPVVRTQQPERSQIVLIGVDTGRLMAAQSGRLSKLDHAINAALLLAFVALRSGDRVGLVTFSDEVHRYLPPRRGRTQYRRILDALYQIEAARTYVDYRAYARSILALQRRRALVLTFTDLFDETASGELVLQMGRMARRHLPVVITLRDPALDRMVADAEDPWRMAVAAELLDERESLRRGLKLAGARVLDPLPDESVVAAVNTYVELKRRQAL